MPLRLNSSIDASVPIPPALLAEIGALVTSFSDLEDVLALRIFQLSQMYDLNNGYVVISQMPVRQKVDTIETLTSIVIPEDTKHFAGIIGQISDIALFRNLVCHGLYRGHDSGNDHYIFGFTSRSFALGNQRTAGHEGLGISIKSLQTVVENTRRLVQQLEIGWRLKTYRAKRHAAVLQVTQPGQRPRQAVKTARQKRQRRSSRA